MRISLAQHQVHDIERIEDFLRRLNSVPNETAPNIAKKRALLRKCLMAGRGLTDFIRVFTLSILGRHSRSVVLMTRELLLYERFIAGLDLKQGVLINYHQTSIQRTFRGKHVYNLGVLVGMIKRLPWYSSSFLRDVKIFRLLYELLEGLLDGAQVFIPCYYDASGLALCLGRGRDHYELIEVQHGGICNFEPYKEPVSFRLADKILVFDARTAAYLRDHLYREVDVAIEIMESPDSRDMLPVVDNEIPVVLYCSTIEIGGVDPRFLSYLESCRDDRPFTLRVRLHPRESSREELFRAQVAGAGWDFEFDRSPDWRAGNAYQRLIVVTPWSSIVEEAARAGVPSVILDPYGKERFSDLINGQECWYAVEIRETLEQVFRRFKEDRPISER